jgi:uncharacterized glyoxalase superfamily protein PhnB
MSGPPEDAKEPRTSLAPMLSVGNGAKAIEFYDRDTAFARAAAAGAKVVRPVGHE